MIIKRAQIAFEFLSTYGWAFLVILIMISAMSYFGVLRPSKLFPDRCSFGLELKCEDFQISWAGAWVKLRLKNNLGKPIAINSFTAYTISAPLSCVGPDLSGVWADGFREFAFKACNLDEVGLIPGEKGKIFFKINYYALKSGPEYSHYINGDIVATVVST